MATSLTPQQRTLRARLGAHALHAQRDGAETTAAARAAFLSRFEREVDPDGLLAPEERARRAAHARKAHFTRMVLMRSRSTKKTTAITLAKNLAVVLEGGDGHPHSEQF
jgi:hypothetical protein